MLDAAADGLARRGRCVLGDKTILDTLHPAAAAYAEMIDKGADSPTAAAAAIRAASRGMRGTRDWWRGGALPCASASGRSGHRDPGAVSCLLLLLALAAP